MITATSSPSTMQETIDFYRQMKIGFVNFTVDAENRLGRRRRLNEEIAEAAQANSFKDEVRPLILKENAKRLLKLA